MIRKDEQVFDAFVQGLRELGWIDGRNVQLDIRWAAEVATAFANNTLQSWSRCRRT